MIRGIVRGIIREVILWKYLIYSPAIPICDILGRNYQSPIKYSYIGFQHQLTAMNGVLSFISTANHNLIGAAPCQNIRARENIVHQHHISFASASWRTCFMFGIISIIVFFCNLWHVLLFLKELSNLMEQKQ